MFINLRSSINSLPAWFEKTNFASQRPATEKSITTEKVWYWCFKIKLKISSSWTCQILSVFPIAFDLFQYTRVEVESKKSWKRCSAHVYIGRLIKVLQVSERKEGLLPEKPTQVITCEGADLWTHHASIHNQMTGRDDRNDCVSFSHSEKNSFETQNDLMYKRAIQDQQLAPATPASSSKQVSWLSKTVEMIIFAFLLTNSFIAGLWLLIFGLASRYRSS